jgi:hypothetical protein
VCDFDETIPSSYALLASTAGAVDSGAAIVVGTKKRSRGVEEQEDVEENKCTRAARSRTDDEREDDSKSTVIS